MFEHRTYVVCDIPEPMATQITAIRKRFDAYTASLPAEITVIGSGGVGTIAEGQSPTMVFETLDHVAAAGGKGAHRKFTHARYAGAVTLSGRTGDDAKPYQERQVKQAIEQVRQ